MTISPWPFKQTDALPLPYLAMTYWRPARCKPSFRHGHAGQLITMIGMIQHLLPLGLREPMGFNRG